MAIHCDETYIQSVLKQGDRMWTRDKWINNVIENIKQMGRSLFWPLFEIDTVINSKALRWLKLEARFENEFY
jgi:hypothetical protein